MKQRQRKRREPEKPISIKATKAVVARRIEEVLRIRLDGAEFWDVREYAREKEHEQGSAWELKDGAKALSDGTLWRYIGRADKLIAESCRASTKKLTRRHLAQRRNLYAKAVLAGDYRTALAALRDEAEMLGLYPAKPSAPTGQPNAGSLECRIILTERKEYLIQLARELADVPEAREKLASLYKLEAARDEKPGNDNRP
jgi:hypothetical protein